MLEFEKGDLVEMRFKPNQRGVSIHSFCFFVSEISVECEEVVLTFIPSVFNKNKRFFVTVRENGTGEFCSCGSDDVVYSVFVRKIEELDLGDFDIQKISLL